MLGLGTTATAVTEATSMARLDSRESFIVKESGMVYVWMQCDWRSMIVAEGRVCGEVRRKVRRRECGI